MRSPEKPKSARRPFPAAPPATVRTATHGQRTHPPSLCRPGLPHSARSLDRSPLREVFTIAVAVAKASDTTAAAAPARPRPWLCSRLLLQQAPSYPRGPETRNHFLPEWSGPTPLAPPTVPASSQTCFQGEARTSSPAQTAPASSPVP